jgi:hypothetical protein
MRGSRMSLIVLSVLAVACATPGGPPSSRDSITVKPSEIGAKFAALDTSAAMQTELRRVAFEKVGATEYDAFLKKAASTILVVSMTDATLESIERATQRLALQQEGPVSDHEALGRAVAERHAVLTNEQRKDVLDQLAILDELLVALKETPTRAAELADEGKALTQKASAAMTSNPFGMMTAGRSMGAATARLASTTSDVVPAVNTRAAAVLRLLAVCRCTTTEAAVLPAEAAPKLAATFPEGALTPADARVLHPVTELDDFDPVFVDVARLRAVAVFEDVWVREVAKTVAEMGGQVPATNAAELREAIGAIDKKKLKALASFKPRLKAHVQQLQALVTELNAVPEAAEALTAKLQSLGPAAAEAATTSPARMAGLSSAVQTATEQTAESAKRATASASMLKALVGPLKAIGGA